MLVITIVNNSLVAAPYKNATNIVLLQAHLQFVLTLFSIIVSSQKKLGNFSQGSYQAEVGIFVILKMSDIKDDIDLIQAMHTQCYAR
jgi:hypothetical protein